MKALFAAALFAALALSPPLVVASVDDDGGEPGADATKSGAATFRFQSVVVNQDSGSGSQSATKSGPLGETTCVCRRYSLGICQSYGAAGEYRVTWQSSRWSGRNSALSFSGSTTRTYAYSTENGWQSVCNAQLAAAKGQADASAGIAASGFRTVPTGSASGYTGVGASVGGTAVIVPFVRIDTRGSGTWVGSDVSWSFSYAGDASVSGVKVCSNCVAANGASSI